MSYEPRPTRAPAINHLETMRALCVCGSAAPRGAHCGDTPVSLGTHRRASCWGKGYGGTSWGPLVVAPRQLSRHRPGLQSSASPSRAPGAAVPASTELAMVKPGSQPLGPPQHPPEHPALSPLPGPVDPRSWAIPLRATPRFPWAGTCPATPQGSSQTPQPHHMPKPTSGPFAQPIPSSTTPAGCQGPGHLLSGEGRNQQAVGHGVLFQFIQVPLKRSLYKPAHENAEETLPESRSHCTYLQGTP